MAPEAAAVANGPRVGMCRVVDWAVVKGLGGGRSEGWAGLGSDTTTISSVVIQLEISREAEW